MINVLVPRECYCFISYANHADFPGSLNMVFTSCFQYPKWVDGNPTVETFQVARQGKHTAL